MWAGADSQYNMVTQTKTRDEAELEMLKVMVEADKAPDPATEGIISKGDEAKNQPPITTTIRQSAGNVWLRRNSDGKLVQVNRNNLRFYLNAKFADGRPQFLPRSAPFTGRTREPRYWCTLSANHPDRPKMDDLNLEVCTKRGKLMTEAAVRRHLMKKHKDSWDAIQRDREERRQDARDRRDGETAVALQSALVGKKAAPAETVSKEPPQQLSETCATCGEVFTATVRAAAKNKLAAHERKAHKEGG